MCLTKIMITVTACVLATTPTLAASASKLSLSNAARTSSEDWRRAQQAGGFPFLIVFVAIAAGAGLYFAVESDDEPDSD